MAMLVDVRNARLVQPAAELPAVATVESRWYQAAKRLLVTYVVGAKHHRFKTA